MKMEMWWLIGIIPDRGPGFESLAVKIQGTSRITVQCCKNLRLKKRSCSDAKEEEKEKGKTDVEWH